MTQGVDAEALAGQMVALTEELRLVRGDSETLRGLLAAVPAIVARLDEHNVIVDITRVVSGFEYSAVVGSDFFAYLPHEARARLRALFDEVRDTGAAKQYSTIGPGPYGTTAAYDSYVANAGGRSLVVVAIDVTERHEKEAALALSEATSALAVEATGIGLWSLDGATMRVRWNEAMYRLTGLDAPIEPPDFVAELVHPDDRETIAQSLARIVVGGYFQTPTVRIVRPDGELRYLVISGQVFLTEGGEIDRIIGATLDVTAERMIEQRLRHRQGLEAVGQLAAGVAHNFNNILASILPVLDLVAPLVPDRYRGVVAGARDSAVRAAELVRQLMTFAGQRNETARASMPIAQVVGNAVGLCRRMLDERIQLVFEDHGEDTHVLCNAVAIEQCIVNLVLNARDAIFETERGEGTVRVLVHRVGDEALIVVADDGAGMSEAVQWRMFEPFFTTKEVHRGTGLGLAITYATVRDHSGSIHCVSRTGVGTTFELRIPQDRR